jgi:hypothetical protein
VSTKGRAQRVAARAVIRNDRLKHNVEHLVGGLLASNRPAARLGRLMEHLHQTTQGTKEDATRTKEPRSTIGVSSVIAMRQEIAREAEERDVTYALVAREAFERGLEALDTRLWDEPSKLVLGEFATAYANFGSGDTAQWSLRVSREHESRELTLNSTGRIRNQSRLDLHHHWHATDLFRQVRNRMGK